MRQATLVRYIEYADSIMNASKRVNPLMDAPPTFYYTFLKRPTLPQKIYAHWSSAFL